MSKFKVGDYAKPQRGYYVHYPKESNYNLPREAMRVAYSTDGAITLHLPDGSLSPALNPECFDLASPSSAVRTVTRREIVPGTYGGVVIDEHQHGAPLVRFNAKADAVSLRAAATLFNELADVLDENQREAA